MGHLFQELYGPIASIVIEVKGAKTGRLWKFGFSRDMSLALGVHD
jgi:hypothetical protein